MIKSKPRNRKPARQKNPDLHNFISLSLENIKKTRKKLDECQVLLEEILNSSNFNEQDFREMNDIEYRNDNPVYELYQQYREVLANANVAAEQTKYIIEIAEGYKSKRPKRSKFYGSFWA